MVRKSKKKKLEELEAARVEERKSIKEKLENEELYSPSVDPLIENYLDAFIIYKSMYEEWRDKGFPPTKLHENKAGAINEMKHPLAQHVETWNDKKNKMLDALGMTNKRKIVPKAENSDEKKPSLSTISSLENHRNKWRNSG
ncbi:P27 family phage terminase small subunit [Lactococcus garvieae]|uniref:P27 family phage terminase small subunit n=1 Tax=Lactococcus garvieae TaxID=1363 RepID=UPI0030D38DF0